MLMGYILPAGNALSSDQINQVHSDGNVKAIANLLLKYQREHAGRKPDRLTELIPYAGGYLEVFYLPTSISKRPSDWATNSNRIDDFGGYALTNRADLNVSVYEKPGAWADGTIAVAYNDGTVRRLSAKEFQDIKLP